MESTRQLKIGRLIQKDLSEIFLQDAKALFHGSMITVTRVRVTRDLSMARVFLSLFATGDKQQLLDNINQHIPQLRHKLATRIGRQVRVIPALEFHIDDSLDYIENIESLL